MRSAEQVRRDFVQQWLSKAERDLEAARVLLQSGIWFYALMYESGRTKEPVEFLDDRGIVKWDGDMPGR